MRPTPIPEEDVWEGGKRLAILPPGGDFDLGIGAVEAIVDETRFGLRFVTRWVPEGSDLLRLQAGEPLYLSICAPQMVPVDLTLAEVPDGLEVCGNCGGYVALQDGVHAHAQAGRPDCPAPVPFQGG